MKQRKAGIQINDLEQEKINIQQEQNEEIRIKKKKKGDFKKTPGHLQNGQHQNHEEEEGCQKEKGKNK